MPSPSDQTLNGASCFHWECALFDTESCQLFTLVGKYLTYPFCFIIALPRGFLFPVITILKFMQKSTQQNFNFKSIPTKD